MSTETLLTIQTLETTITETQERVYHPPPGEWLFKVRDEIYGPVTSAEIVDRMFSGEVTETTQVSLEEGEWRIIEDIESFRPYLIKAKATRQARRARVQAERAMRRRRRRMILKMMLMSASVLSLGFAASYYLIVHRSESGEVGLTKWAGKHLPLLQINSGYYIDGISSRNNRERKNIQIDQIFIDDAPALVGIRTVSSADRRRKNGKSKPAVRKVASIGQLTNEEITAVVYNRRNIQRLYSCIRTVMRTKSDVPSEITIEFSISNDGRAGQLRMDNINLEGGLLHECFSRKIAALRFRPYSGQVRNVTIPFNVKKRE